MSDSENLRQSLKSLHVLPAIPELARDILALKVLTYEGEQELLKLIENDPSISTKVVGLANSPLFGTSRKITSVRNAVSLLGIKRVKMIALSFAMMTAMARTREGLLNVHKLWQHCLTVTMAMHTMSKYMPADACPQDDDIFLAGLLHDIGFLVLDYIDPMLSDKFHARLAAETGLSIEEVEDGVLEMSHSELGAELGSHWGLPESIVAVLRYHHTPNAVQSLAGQPLVNMVNLAEKLLPTFRVAEQVQPDITPDDWESLGIDPSHAAEIMEEVNKHAEEVAIAFA